MEKRFITLITSPIFQMGTLRLREGKSSAQHLLGGRGEFEDQICWTLELFTDKLT